MKRRVLSLITALALCLSLCPVQVLAAGEGTDDSLCPHHPAHTEECGYVPPASEKECTHNHDDGCYTVETDCIHEHTAECYANPDYASETDEPDACTHTCTEDSGCITRTLSCPHVHDDTCGYAPENPGEPCAFVCKICPIDRLMDQLPLSVSADNIEQAAAQLNEIYDLYDELTADEQELVDLSPCLSLQNQMDEVSAEILAAGARDPSNVETAHILDTDKDYTSPVQVSVPTLINTNGHTASGVKSTVLQVTETGELYLEGTVTSQKGAGVEILSNGFLSVTGENTAITGTTYALDVSSGAEVQLSAGTYTGESAAIHMADGSFADLLAPGCSFFDADGNPILPENAAAATTLVVGPCANHPNKSYVHTGTEHTWSCPFCAAVETEPCAFSFDENGAGTCVCGNSLVIAVDERDLTDLVYDSTIKPENVNITVTLTDGSNQELVKDTDYEVTYEPRKDAGEITVAVTGITFEGSFTKIYHVDPDLPGIKWDEAAAEFDYDGTIATIEDKLPHITITLKPDNDEDLHQYLQYSYREVGTQAFTDGLPLDAGRYEVKAYIPESQNYEAAETDSLLALTIKKINPVAAAPEAAAPTYNRSSQELVTAGLVDSRAVGAEILFATSEGGAYSAAIPTGIDAGDYHVWYKVEGTGNYDAVGPVEVPDVKILRKQITPFVTLSETSYLYDGGYKRPDVTVKDLDNVTVLLDTEYQVAYVNNRNVSTEGNPAQVVVTDKDGGNYAINEIKVDFQITSRTQETLSITDKPDRIVYGDEFTLSTLGGAGSGDVTWEIVSGPATVNSTGGQVKITGDGEITIKATKSGTDPDTGVKNYDDATASWTFDAAKRPVVATVTAKDKTFNNDTDAVVQAVVEQGVLPGDEITITGLTGQFDTENAGVDKTVTVTVDEAKVHITGHNSEHYAVSYSSLTVKAAIHKAVATITSVSRAENLVYDGTPQDLMVTAGAVVEPSSVPVEYALSEDGPYTQTSPTGTSAGKYTVWYRVAETDNYTGLPAASTEVEIGKKPVTPDITLSGDGLQTDDNTASPIPFYLYDGNAKEPTVALAEPDGTPIAAAEYTVAYSGNVNAGNAKVTVTAKEDGNYEFTPNGSVEAAFVIRKSQAQVLTQPKAAGEPLFYTASAQKLVTEGTGSGGTMVYAAVERGEAEPKDEDYSETIPTGVNAADYRVYYKVKGDTNHSDSEVGHADVTIAPKTVKDPTIELFNADGTPLVSYTFDNTAKTPKVVVKDGSTVIGDSEHDEYNVVYSDNVDAGKATVNITDKPGGNYTVTGSTTFVILKADIVFNPAPSPALIEYDGKPHELLIEGVTDGGEVLYARDSKTSTYNAAIPTATDAGTYTVWYKVTGDKNHNDFAAKSETVTIERKKLTQVIIELTAGSFEYDGTVKLPGVTVKDVNTVLPESEYKVTYTPVDNPTDQGTYTITITDAEGGNYDLTRVTDNTATFTIGQAAQAELVIDHSQAATTNYGDTFTLTAAGGSSASAVTWAVTDGPARIDANGDVQITGVGEVTITATNPGDQNYLPVSAQWTFTAAPKPVTASVVVSDKVYDGAADATVASASIATLNGDVVTIDETTITAAFDSPGVGNGKTVTLDASQVQVTGAVGNYAISYPGTAAANITKGAAQITADPAGIPSLKYNGEPQELVTPGETSVGFIVYSLDGTSFSPEIPTGTNAELYTVYYKVDETDDYAGAAGGTKTVTIAPKDITPKIELSESSFVYDGSRKEPKITVKDGNTVIDPEQYTVDWTGDSNQAADDMLTVVGTYTATIKNVTVGNNYTFSKTAEVKITPAGQTALNITNKPAHVRYGDTVTTLDTTGGTGDGKVTWSITAGGASSTIHPETGRLSVNDTGSITVEAKRTVPNHETVTDTWTFTVEPKPVTAKVTITGKDYDGTTRIADADITAEISDGDFVDPADRFTISGLKGAYVDASAGAGKQVTLNKNDVTVSAQFDPAKYAVSYPDTATADITPRHVTIAVTLSDHDLDQDANGYYYAFDGQEKEPAVTVTGTDGAYSAALAASDYAVAYSGNKNVGTATVTVTNAAGGNYTFDDEVVNFAIRPATAKLTKSPEAKVLEYTGQPQELVTVGTVEGGHIEYAVNGGSFGPAIPTGEEAKTYIVTYKAVGEGNYESDTVVGSVSVTIKPKEIVSPKITVDGTYTYNGQPQEPGSNVKVEDGNTLIPASEYTLTYSGNTDAGTATVRVINANGGNYIVNGTATFTIGKADASVAEPPQAADLPYNGTQQVLLSAPGAAAHGTMVYSLDKEGTYSPVIPTAKDRGNYIVWYKAQGDGNYNDSAPGKVEGSIIVNNVTNPTVQVTPGSVTYNGQKQEPVVTVMDKGLVIDGSEYNVAYVDENNNSDLIGVGTYTVTITNTASSNYIINDSSARFEILKAGQTPLTITGTREHVYYGDSIKLGTTGGNGAIAWAVDSGSPATIDNNGLLNITGVGSVTVTATSTATGYEDQTATWSFYADKKPVTAVVTAAAITYDGVSPASTTVTATLQPSDLVGGDSFQITLSGTFEDPNAGADKKVNIDSTAPKFTVTAGDPDNYNITYPATATSSILKAEIDPSKVTPPEMKTGLEYTGDPQYLVKAGSSPEGSLEYSKDGGVTYSAGLPTGTGAGGYDIWYRVKGDGNHKDLAGRQLGTVTIAPQDVTDPFIEFTPNNASYDGAVHKPSVTVKDNSGRVVPETEYTVTYGGTDWKTAGAHEVTVTDKDGGNYKIGTKVEEFTILMMGQNPLSIVNQPGKVQYGDTFTLSTAGGSGTGAVSWECGSDVASIDQNGRVTTLKAGGPVTITATKAADDNYGAVSVSWTFYVENKPVTAIVTALDKEYDATNEATLVITWSSGSLLNGDTIDLDSILTGTFDNANVGNNKRVTITDSGNLPSSGKYAISYNVTTTASITPKAASATAPTALNPEYSGKLQDLAGPGSAANGTIYYSLDGVSYGPNIPQAKNAGQYTIWYKAVADEGGNYKDSPAGRVPASILPREVETPVIELSKETFDYDGAAKRPDVVVKDGSTVIPASEYTVSYSNNTEIGTATVTITDADDGNYTVNGSKSFTIKAGEAALTTPPQEKALTYNGFAQELVLPGTAVNGQLVYSKTGNEGDYDTSIPKETNAGTYPVYYKVQGNNGAAGTAARVTYVTIQPKPVTSVITLKLTSDPAPYTGSPIRPDVTVVVEGKALNKGTDYTVTYSNNTNVGTAAVTVQSVSGSNYQFHDTAEFEIAKSKAAFDMEPKGLTNLVYTGEPQELIEEYTGISTEGIVLYSLNAVTYSADIPTGTNVRKYTIYAKIQGDSTHADSDVFRIPAEIAVNELQADDLIVELSANSLPYTGSEQKPTVTVTDRKNGKLIQAGEYTVSYSDNINVGTASVTVESKGNNYRFNKTVSFEITSADQPALTITGKPGTVYYGDTLRLGVTGGSDGGAVTWSVEDGPGKVNVLGGGQFQITGSGSITIKAVKAASGGYKETSDMWTFFAQPKPIAAAVTAADRPYAENDTTVTLTVAINSGDLVSGDDASGVKAEGHFADANAGTNKTVFIDKLVIPENIRANYTITHPATTTASITPKAASVTGSVTQVSGLKYTGSAQALVSDSGCTVEGGTLAYSLDGVNYSFLIPTGTDVGSYTVWYKVAAGENYKDSAVQKVEGIVIGANTDTPRVSCTPDVFQYDGTEKTPTVVVRDAANRIIPDSEYTVTFPAPRIAADVYTVTVEDIPGGSYEFSGQVTGSFEIAASSQNPLSIITDKPADLYYGDSFRLSAMGGSGNGAIHWKIEQTGSVAEIDNLGVVTLKDVGGFTVKAYREAEGGYSQSNTASVQFYVHPKPITPVVTAANKPYDGTRTAKLAAACKSGDVVGNDEVIFTMADGQFDSPDAGTNKTVTLGTHTVGGTDAGKYDVTWPDSTTATIYKVDAKIENAPGKPSLTYNGTDQALVTGGSTVNGIGRIEYSLDEKGEYSERIPTAINAGTYTVWYKVADSVNYTGIAPASVEVIIGKATPSIITAPTAASVTSGQPLSASKLEGGSANGVSGSIQGSFAWTNGNVTVDEEKTYEATFTPADTANYNTQTVGVAVTFTKSAEGGGSADTPGDDTGAPADMPSAVNTADTPTQTTIQNGTASTVVSVADGSRLVREAVENQSETVVIKPEITGDVTKTEVSIPAETISQIERETNAALTVSAPIADVTISHEALDTLSRTGGTVSVATEQVGQSVVMTLTAGGETIESIPGGVILSVPVEDAAPGTVAVLVHADGTRETLRKSVVDNGMLNIPLDGSATVEIVDNSKSFTDVEPTSWAADAIAFASARDLFNGTSETTFGPDEAISRGVLANALYTLEGRPSQALTSEFSDVSSDDWYADSISWAVANGIASGYGDGQFGPNDSITREQFIVMLWRYAGSPAAGGEAPDADQVSGDALEALRWAAEKGIMNGCGSDQLDPGGIATRAQAAQMLKNFMENT